MEYKSGPQFTKSIDGRTVVGIFAVHGVIDDGKDRSWPGSFSDTAINGRNRARFLWQHDKTQPPIAAIRHIREVGRLELPQSVLSYAPEATGGVEVAREYLDTPRGNEVLEGIKAGAIEEMSYAYELPYPDSYDVEEIEKQRIRNFRRVALFDISDVNWGMNPATQGVKGLGGDTKRFDQHSMAVGTAVQEFVERAKARHEARLKAGRTFSAANESRMRELLNTLQGACSGLEELLALLEPAPMMEEAAKMADPDEAERLYIEHLSRELRLKGVVIA